VLSMETRRTNLLSQAKGFESETTQDSIEELVRRVEVVKVIEQKVAKNYASLIELIKLY